MKPTPKTDSCIKMLNETEYIFWALPEKLQAVGKVNRKDDLFRTLVRSRAILEYKVLPCCTITIEEDKKKDKESLRAFMQKYDCNTFEPYFDEVWEVLTRFETVAIQDLKDEFWDICPDLDNIVKFIGVMQVKFNKVLCNIPETKEHPPYYSKDYEWTQAVKYLEDNNIISKKEADSILFDIHSIAEGINIKVMQIANMYRDFKDMAEPQQEKPKPPKPLPMRLKDNEAKSLRILLINKNQIDKDTEERTFLYWFGCGEYSEEIKPIIWIGTRQIARELLEGLYKSKESSFADIEKIVSVCFIKDKTPMKLAKNKKVPSLESDAIAGFLATIKKD